MNFKDQIQQIFGTTDIHELKQISRDADNYRCLNADMNNSIISEKKKNRSILLIFIAFTLIFLLIFPPSDGISLLRCRHPQVRVLPPC